MELILIFISAALVNNFVLAYFLGICPFVGVSNKTENALNMGLATTFVMPLTTTNCAVLGLALFMVLREYGFIESIIFGFATGVGFTLAIVMMSGIREELEFADIPKHFQGVSITLIIAGMMALAFMGFAGLIRG